MNADVAEDSNDVVVIRRCRLAREHHESFVAKVTRDRQAGYVGAFLDDANFGGGNIPGSQEVVRTPTARSVALMRCATG